MIVQLAVWFGVDTANFICNVVLLCGVVWKSVGWVHVKTVGLQHSRVVAGHPCMLLKSNVAHYH